MPDDPDYDVGYGKPPVGTRFRKGKSGNPMGRPKGALNLETVLERTLREKVVVNENGRRRVVSKMEVALKQLANKAAAGELKAILLISQLLRHAEERSTAAHPPEDGSSAKDPEVITTILKRYLPESEGGK